MQSFSKEALAAVAAAEALLANTFSVKISEESGGREATRRLRLYRLEMESVAALLCNTAWLYYLLPVSLHVGALQLASTEGDLASIASKRVGGLHPRRGDGCRGHGCRIRSRVGKVIWMRVRRVRCVVVEAKPEREWGGIQ